MWEDITRWHRIRIRWARDEIVSFPEGCGSGKMRFEEATSWRMRRWQWVQDVGGGHSRWGAGGLGIASGGVVGNTPVEI